MAIFGVVIFSYFLSFLIHKKNDVNALVVGRLWRFEPSLLLRYRFCNNAPSIITHGYNQVSLADTKGIAGGWTNITLIFNVEQRIHL